MRGRSESLKLFGRPSQSADGGHEGRTKCPLKAAYEPAIFLQEVSHLRHSSMHFCKLLSFNSSQAAAHLLHTSAHSAATFPSNSEPSISSLSLQTFEQSFISCATFVYLPPFLAIAFMVVSQTLLHCPQSASLAKAAGALARSVHHCMEHFGRRNRYWRRCSVELRCAD